MYRAVLLAVAVQAVAQQPGQRVMVVTQNREVIEARLERWSDAGAEVKQGSKLRSFALADIRTLRVQEKASRWKAAMWGAIAGFAAVFPCGAAKAGFLTDQNNPRVTTRIGVGAAVGMFGAGIGAGIGALAGGSKYVTVYESKAARR